MTEATWNKSTEPQPMMEALRASGRATERRLRLYAAACCRRIWPLLTDERSWKAVEVAEQFADGLVAKRDFHDWGWLRQQQGGVVALFNARDAAQATASYGEGAAAQAAAASDGQKAAAWEAAFRAAWASGAETAAAMVAADAAVPDSEAWVARREAARNEERAAQAALLRCIFGPALFRPLPPVAPAVLAWNGGIVVKLAAGVYEERDLTQGRMGVLADAAEEAGLMDAELLGHLRGPGPHARGCHVIDLLLGKG
jgi:hypothetical protein